MKNLYRILPLIVVLFCLGCSSSDDENTQPEQLYWKKVYPGWQHTIAIRSDGTLWTWGQNFWGQLGIGVTSPENITTPYQINTDTDWSEIAVGTAHTLAIKSDGTLWGWGVNSTGELGDGTGIGKNHPIQIGTANDWTAVAAGNSHSMALKSDGTLWTWGGGAHGQVGNGTLDDILAPQQIGNDTNWVKIKTGRVSSIAEKSDGTLWLWGRNVSDPATVLLTPTQIGSASLWKSYAIGSWGFIAVKSSGLRWGIGYSSALGVGNDGFYTALTQVGTDSGWQTISQTDYHAIGIKTDGTIWTWGDNSNGQLGNGGGEDISFPQQIGLGSTWEYIAAGPAGHHSFIRKTDKTLWGFGWNSSGQLGDGTETDSNVPILIPCPQ